MARDPNLRGWPKDGEPPFVVDETYVFTVAQLDELYRAVNRLAERVELASFAHAFPRDVT